MRWIGAADTDFLLIICGPWPSNGVITVLARVVDDPALERPLDIVVVVRELVLGGERLVLLGDRGHTPLARSHDAGVDAEDARGDEAEGPERKQPVGQTRVIREVAAEVERARPSPRVGPTSTG